MPIRKSDYPTNWAQLRAQRLAIANHRCEWCEAPNHTWIRRDKRPEQYRMVQIGDTSIQKPYHDFEMLWSAFTPDKAWAKEQGLIYIILTTAHMDRTTTNNHIDNLRSLCQRCHLNHDRGSQHIPNRKYGRRHTKNHQLRLQL